MKTRFVARTVRRSPWDNTAVVVDRLTGLQSVPYSPGACAKREADQLNRDYAAGYDIDTTWIDQTVALKLVRV